jgi:hypothetical protein
MPHGRRKIDSLFSLDLTKQHPLLYNGSFLIMQVTTYPNIESLPLRSGPGPDIERMTMATCYIP